MRTRGRPARPLVGRSPPERCLDRDLLPPQAIRSNEWLSRWVLAIFRACSRRRTTRLFSAHARARTKSSLDPRVAARTSLRQDPGAPQCPAAASARSSFHEPAAVSSPSWADAEAAAFRRKRPRDCRGSCRRNPAVPSVTGETCSSMAAGMPGALATALPLRGYEVSAPSFGECPAAAVKKCLGVGRLPLIGGTPPRPHGAGLRARELGVERGV
jgi:hypothetical protein